MWQSPWDNAVRGGDQVAQATLGAGGRRARAAPALGLGDTRYLPAGHTDLVLAAVGEELGFVGLLVVGACFALIAWRGFANRAARVERLSILPRAGADAVAGDSGARHGAPASSALLPLTGVVTPF